MKKNLNQKLFYFSDIYNDNTFCLNNWIEENYEQLINICKNIGKEQYKDLCSSCIEQLIKSKKFETINSQKEKIYFFSRLVKNNFNSITSIYYYENKKFKYMEYDSAKDARKNEDMSPIEFDLEWVNKELLLLKKQDWYYGRLMELYIEENCSLINLSKRTLIPTNSLSRDLKKVKQILRNKRNEQS